MWESTTICVNSTSIMTISKDKQEGENNWTDLKIDLDIIPY